MFMNARAYGKSNRAARGWALALPVLVGLVLLYPGASWARSQKNPKPAQPAKTASPPAKQSSVVAKTPSGGVHTGITVHGWWKIDVRNPDGKLVRHVEFENSLDPGYNYGANPNPGGAAYLNAVLDGQATPPTLWTIILTGPGGLNNAFSNSPNFVDAPCVYGATTVNLPLCEIAEPKGTNGSGCYVSGGTSCNLSLTPQGTAPNYTGLVISGTINANPPASNGVGQIATVATLLQACGSSIDNCTQNSSYSFTSSTNFPGAPITVSTGQTITATVAITFQ
jgi:hypothetical protein